MTPHRVPIRVRFGELDAYSHVNHTVYLQYFEHGRVVALDDVGHGLEVLMEDDLTMVVAQLSARFIAPAHLGDELVVESGLCDVGRASATWLQRVVRGSDVLVTQVLRAGCTTAAGKPRRYPPGLLEALSIFSVGSDWLGKSAPR